MATKYVSQHGSASNLNGGTNITTDSWATPEYGMANVGTTNTLEIGSGTYTMARGTAQTNIPNGSPGSHTYVKNYQNEVVTLQWAGGSGGILNFNGSTKQYITFEGTNPGDIILDGNSQAGCGAGVYLGPSANNHIELINVEIKNIWNSGILAGTCQDAVLRALHIHDTGLGRPTEYQDHGIYGIGKNLLIEDCVIHDNIGFGLQIYPFAASSTGIILRRNNIYANGHGIIADAPGISIYNNLIHANGHTSGDGYGIMMWSTNNGTVYHNTVYGNDGYGIYVNNFGSSSGVQVKNNLVIGNALGSIRTGNSASSCTVAWNRTDTAGTYGTGTTASNNSTGAVAADEWVDPTGDPPDFNLKSGAGAIDPSGIASVGIGTDFAGTVRPQGETVDIGAYEFGSDPPNGPSIDHAGTYVVTTQYGAVAITLTKGTNNIVECTLQGTGAAALCVDHTNVTVVRVT